MTRGHPLQRGRILLALCVLVASWRALLSRAAAFPDWTDCPTVCRCRWTSGKKSAFCPDAGLTSLPASLDPDMQVLDVSGNQIPDLQAEIFKQASLLNLQRVFLRNAGIRSIHPDAFRDMRILIEVDLSDNHLASLEPRTFTGNERLKLLVLSGNPLKLLKRSQFPKLQHLKSLELQRCSLQRVHPQAFQWLPALETLSLDNNELEYLEAATLGPLKHLKTLGLDNNPWRCDCHLREFCRLLTTNMTRLYSVPQSCIGPAQLQGRRWEDVPHREFACEPTVLLPVSSIQEEVNGNVSLACLVTGDPDPEVRWQLNGIPINGTKRVSDEPPGRLVVWSDSFAVRNHMVERWRNVTIYNTSDADAGEYTCEARNVAGLVQATVTVSIPRIFTAPTLSQSDGWLLWLSLAGGGTVALCVSATVVLLAMCLCGGARRRSRRAKVKLQASASFGDQEKKLLDLSVTTTATTTSQQHAQLIQHHNQNQPIQADLNHCQPELMEPTEEHRGPQSSANVTVERLSRLQPESRGSPVPQLPPPPVLCPVAVAAARAQLPANIYISVSLANGQAAPLSQASPAVVAASLQAAELQVHERCYPDLLDIGLSSFATLPRRCGARRVGGGELGSPYDNMGPRVTATGSSTFSLVEQPEPSIAAAAPLIQPPPEFVSL